MHFDANASDENPIKSPQTAAPNTGGLSNVSDFWPLSRDISETVQDEDIITIEG